MASTAVLTSPGRGAGEERGDGTIAADARTASVADSRVLAWVLVVLLAVVFTVQTAPRISAPFADSHDGDNAAVWGSASRSIREDGFLDSRAGARLADIGGTYAHHPPLIATEVAITETILGEHRWSTRAPAWLGSIAVIFLLFGLLRAHRLRPVPSALGVVVALGSPMFFMYGSMLDTTMVGLPFALGFLLAHRRAVDDTRWYPAVIALAAITTLTSWEGALLCVVVAAVDVVAFLRRRERQRVPATSIGLAAGLVLIGAWLWWSVGSLTPIMQQLSQRSGASGADRSPTDWGTFLDFQWLYLGALLSPLVLLAGIPAAVFGVRDRRTRVLFAGLAIVTVLYPLMLREGAINHDYWNYWLPIPFAVGIAALASRLLERPRAESTPRVVIGGFVALVAVFALLCAMPWNTPARAAYDRGALASYALRTAASEAPPRSHLFLAGHFTSGAPWVTYELRRTPRLLRSFEQVERAAADDSDAPILVKCDRRPSWLDDICVAAAKPYVATTVGELAG